MQTIPWELVGWVLAGIGLMLFLAALIGTVRANPGSVIPLGAKAENNPPATIGLRLVSFAFLIGAAAALTPTLRLWVVPIVFGIPLVLMPIVIGLHNYRARQAE